MVHTSRDMMKPRTLAQVIHQALRTFPAIVVTGPRQSGKTTLLQSLCGRSHRFVTLEHPDVRIRAREDPEGFLDQHRPPVIVDAIQYVPELLSYIKTRIDARRRPGQWVLTGSQNFTLMQGVSQSLAGRVAVLSLLPFSFAERMDRGASSRDIAHWVRHLPAQQETTFHVSLAEVLLRGHYPELASRRSVNRDLWCASYLSTYLERDVRNLAQVGDLSQFERFLRLCATRTGQIVNLSELARDIGVSVPTAKRWLSLLETGHQGYVLGPYDRNLGKRFVKSPKLYFNDTALASYLLGLHDPETLLNSPHFSALFETFIVTDCLKRYLHAGQMPSLYYLRTRDGLEVDLVLTSSGTLHLFEVKSAVTVRPAHAASLSRIVRELGSIVKTAAVISRSPNSFRLQPGIVNYAWQQALVQ